MFGCGWCRCRKPKHGRRWLQGLLDHFDEFLMHCGEGDVLA